MIGLNLTGRRFGMLLVRGRVGQDTCGRKRYRCKCDCGKFCEASTAQLTDAKRPKTNCGCVRKMKRLTHEGRTLTIEQWAKVTGIPAATIYDRIQRDGRTIAEALTPGRLPYR